MASRHEIVTIDFRANAAKANPAMKSLQQAAHDLREEIDKTREAADAAAKNGATEAELQKFEKEITSQLKTLKQYDAAINTLSKGVGTLARAIDAFNAGTLDKMNAAFQKQSFNAAENAKKLLVPGSEGYEKNMAELDALQQKNLENLAKYKLRTEQLLQSIGDGGKISATDLKTEADGLEELMKLLPHLGNEWQEYYQMLLRVRDAIKQQADEEKRLKGAIADANDARARSAQLTKQGAEEARQQHEAAKKEVESHTAIINKLKEEQAEKKKNMAESAAVLQQKDKEIESQKKTVATWETAIKNEKKDTKAREDRIIALQQENETLQTTAETNRKAVDQMKGDMKGLEDQLKDVNAELEKMGVSASEKPAAVVPSAAPATPAANAKKEETQAVEEKTEADKKEEQAVKDKTKAKKDETQAVKENTAAKKEEANVDGQIAESQKQEEVTIEGLIAANDKLKAEIESLEKERKELLMVQRENADAANDEAEAYAKLSKEEAKAVLEQKQARSTFKSDGGKMSITNREEAQSFLMDTIRGINNGNLNIENAPEKMSKVFAAMQERYGLKDEGEALSAVRSLVADGGLIEKGGFATKFFVTLKENIGAVKKFEKDIQTLTDVMNGNTKAVEENVTAGRTLEQIEQEIAEKEAQRTELSKRTVRLRQGITDQLVHKKDKLTETSRKSAEAFKEELAVIQSLNKEQAALMLKGMKEASVVKYKGGKPFASDIDEVQSWLIRSIKDMTGKGHASESNGTLNVDEKGISSLVASFKERYKWVSDDKKALNDLFKSVVQSKGGMFESGLVSGFGKGGKLIINYDTEAFKQRVKVMDTLAEVSGSAAQATDKVTESTKKNTKAVKEGNDAIAEQKAKVDRLKESYDEQEAKYRKYNDIYREKVREVKRLKKGSLDEQVLAVQKEDEADSYRGAYVDPAYTNKEKYKKLYTSAKKSLDHMLAQQTQSATATENQNTEATERNTQAKGRKAKATKAAADAQKEQNKADGESIAQGQQLSAEEQKKQELLRKSEALQGQLNEKQEQANQLEEEAEAADIKRKNNLKTITDLQNENINAHTKNEQGYKREKEKQEELERQQGKNIEKYNEAKEAVEGYTQKIDEHATKRADANKRAAQTERLTIDAMNDAIKALEAENRAIDPQSAKWQENTRVIQQYKAEIDRLKNQPVLQMMTERMGNIRNLSADALTETKRFWEQMAAGAEHGSQKLAVYEGNLRVIAEEERQRQQQIQAPMRERLSNLGRLSTADLTETKRYWQTVRDGADQTSAAYKKAELAVKALTNEENRRKANAQAQYINDQMKDLNNLSVTGLAEVKRYWQAMADGAKRGSDEAKDAANALARINEVELRNTKQQVRPLFGDLSKKGTEEIRAAIEAGRRLIDTYDSGSPAAQRLSQAIVDAEEHLRKYGVEAERAARREAAAVEEAAQRRKEQDNLMRQQLDQGAALSDSALKAQQQYWQRLIDDPKTAKESLAGYRYELERTIELQEQQARTTNNDRAARISSPSKLGNYSTAELRESIEAAKQLAASYQSGSKEAQDLTKNIIAAEEYISKYSLETARAARKEAQAIADMREQLNLGTSLTESALKAQENYWRRLADQPGIASAKVKEYTANMQKAQELQTKLVADRGADTLQRAQNGEFATASMDELDKTIKKLKEYQALIKDPNNEGKEAFEATKEQVDALTEQLNKLKGVAEKVKGSFKDADEVLARFGEHMNAGKTASEGMAQSLDEKLAGKTSSYDALIEGSIKSVEEWERDIQEATKELADMEKELAELEAKHKNSSWFRKKTQAYRQEGWRIEDLRDEIEGHEVKMDDGSTFRTGKKQEIEDLQGYKQNAQDRVDSYKKLKALELGITEETEEKKQDAQRLTQEQMQEGIKLLEEEYRKTDHTTEDGIKKRERLRQTIDQMNQEIKESTGEWMSYAEAEKFAAQAGTEGFIATGQQMKQAQEALERQRDSLIKSIQTKRQEKNMTDEQKKALAAEEAQLDKVNAELKKMKFEMDNTNMSAKRMNEILDNPSAAKNIEELGQAVKRAQAQLKVMEDTVGDTNKEYQEMAQKTKEAAQRQKELETQFKASASAFDKAWSRLKTYVGLYVGASVAMQKLTGTMGDLMDLSDKMGEVRKTTGFTADEVGRLSGELKKFDTRTTLNGLLDLSVAAGQLGLNTEEDVLGFTEAANKLMVALPEMGREGATEMLKVALATGEIDKIRKQMEQGLIEGSSATAVAMEKVGSTIDRLRATSAATAPAITDFVKRVGAVGAQSGITIDQVAALGSTVDALGMRVEMSATALSRMIPAIKNNAFDVAKAIGVAPEYLRGLFDEAGGGMKAMLMIFQHIKDSGMSEDNIEKMLGMGNLKEIMKELNQQGARAGIVFSGLSQNVDTLREHLSTASDAYRENVAIQQEYEKMNETTMAKWERLKNEIEEMFVGDGAQRFLGGIIDGIREIVDLLTGPLKGAAAGLGAGLSAYRLGLGSLLEKMWDFARGEEDVTEKWKEWTEKLKDKDVWGIVTSGVIAAGVAIYTYVDSLQEAAREAAKFARDVVDEQNKVENLTKAIGDAKTKVEEADKEVEKARKAVDEAKKSLDGTKESTDRLTEANSKLLVSEEKKRNEMATQKKLIETFNNEYGKYLGFMLSEVSSNYELIKARDLANTKLRETIALKRKEAALGRIEESEGEGRDEAYAALSQAVSGSIRKQVVTGRDKNGKEIKTWANDQEATTRLLRDLTKMAQAQNMTAREVEKALADAGLNIYEKRNGKQQINTYGANLRNLVMNYRKEYQTVQSKIKDVETQFDVEASIDREEAQGKLKEQFKASEKNYADLETSYAKAQGDARKQAAANLLKQADTLEEMISAAPNYYDLSNDTEKAAYEKFVTDTQKRIDGIKEQRESLLKEAGTLYKSRKTVQGETTTSLTPTSPWGGNAPADSTDYGTWDVNELVARRNQMDKFKNVLKPDTDIRAVLAEDKALMKALDNGLKEDWKSVLGWYNTERKKIQEELKSERFSTNEGHWRDEKQGRGRKNRFRESDYALAELDRYYSKRKEDLEKARIKENMSEELFNRQAEMLEQEHLERRSKLRETFTAGSTEQEKKMVKQFREWWSQLEKQGLLDEVPWATVESEWSKALASEIGRNNLRAQQDLTKLQEITVKHLNEIAKLIDKERPYDGITANLRKNLTEMDILLADLQKDGPEKDTAKLVKAETIRLKFLLSEAEQAYSLNFEQLKEKMIKEGFGEWAQAIEGDEQLKQSLMQNLRNTYDAIQEAIKKESSVIKKQLEIQWNDLMPGSDMSMKGTFEKAVSDLGLTGDQVKRANSLIGAGTASDRVADKLAIQQMRIQLQMQETYFALMQKIGRERIKQLEQSAVANEREAKALKEKAELLRKEGKTAEAEVTELKAQNALRQSLQDKFDAEHAAKSLSLARTKELAEEEKQRVAIANQLEESQNRLYTELKSWADLLASSLQGVFEASHTADREYYNERAKMDLTGKGGPGAGTYIVIENEGTSDARAHYEYLDERQALERQREIENDNAVAEAWKKMLDDLNQKMSDTITDQLNAMLQSQSIDANTQAVIKNTEALWAQLGQGSASDFSDASKLKRNAEGMAVDESGQPIAPIQPTEVEQSGGVPKAPWQMTEDELAKNQENMYGMWQAYKEYGIAAETEKAAALAEIPGYTPSPLAITEEQVEAVGEIHDAMAQKEIDASKKKTEAILADQQKVKRGEQDTQNQMVKGSQSAFAKMTAAANLYGIAYQTMSNDNLSAAQKFEMLALQAAGQAAMSMLTMDLAKEEGKTTMMMPGILGKLFGEMPYPAAIATFAVITALMGGLMGLAVSQVTKSKSQISQVTGSSMNAGRLSTGMLTYAEGNVNEFTDPATLTPGRSYNVDAADGRTYRAKYTGTNPKTHITSGPEFHLVGERGQEAIIDAKTTRQIRMDDNGIWQSIQTLYNGGRLSASRRRRAGRGMAAFADGNLDEFEEIGSEAGTGDGGAAGMGTEQMAAFQSSLDRNNELLERALTEGIHARFDVYGKGGLIDSYDTGKKTVSRHGEKF